MSPFPMPLDLEYLNGRTWRLLTPFTFATTHHRHAKTVTVPAGFLTDFASVPRFFWRVLPPTGPYGKATVIHDYLYSLKPTDRLAVDQIFLDAMRALRVPPLTRWTMYAAVRLFGWLAWSRHA